MQSTTIQALKARQQFGELLELAYYKGKRFRIARKNKAMAWLVGEPYIEAIDRIIDYLIEHQPAIADTLAIMLDDELRQAIEEGTKEVKAGKTIPIEKALED